jgi:predicted HAD superfamily phosphohydrolase
MAALDPNVYKTPSFTELGMKKDKQVAAERDFRAKETAATGAESAFGTAQYELTGVRKDVLQGAYDTFSEAAIKYQKSGSESDKKAMRDLANKVNFFSGAGMAMQGEWNNTYAQAKANEFTGYAESPESIQERYNNRMFDKTEVKTENGQILVKEGDKFVPAEQSSFFSSKINPNNSFLLPKAVQTGKFVLPTSYTEEIKGVLKSSSSPEQAISKATSEFTHRLKNDPAFRQDVGMHYAISELGIIDGKQGISRDDVRKVEERMQDEDFFNKAVESYLGNIESTIKNTMGGSAIQSNPSYIESVKVGDSTTDVEMFAIEKVGDILGVGMGEDGTFYISKQIASGVPPQTVKASEAELAQIERKLGVSVRSMAKEEEVVKQPAEQAKEEITPEAEEVKQMLPSMQEVKGTEGDGLGLGFTPQTGRAAPADSSPTEKGEALLPNWYYDNLIKFEGGVSTDKDDNAWALNPDAPKVNGKRAHTNRGVQWNVYKNYAERNNIPESDWEQDFLKMSEDTAKNIVDDYAEASGASNFQDPVLRSFFTQNSWGTGKVWAADFKEDRSKDYRALLDWLQSETGLDFQNTGKINAEEAKAIEELYNKDPEAFIKEFAKKKEAHFKTLDDYKKFGKGWINRLKELESEALASI